MLGEKIPLILFLSIEDVHPWITRMTNAMMQGAVADCFKRFPMIARLILTFFGSYIRRIIADTKINEEYSIDLVERCGCPEFPKFADELKSYRRIQRRTDRKDFYTRILENRLPEAFSDIQLAAHASDFVLAGSETSSTCLSTITYHLFKTPRAARKLQEEIRGAFTSYSDINAASTATLEYMHAVILEGLRIYPPLPFALPRLVPQGGDTVDGHFLPAKVRSFGFFTRLLLIRLSDDRIHKPSRRKPRPSQLRRSSRFQTREMARKE